MPKTVPVQSVEFNYSENSRVSCGVKFVDDPLGFKGDAVEQASRHLAQAALYAPANGGYHKTEFTVTWEDGNQYTGRIDLKHQHKVGYDVREHIREFAIFHSGRQCPPHLTRADYEGLLKAIGAEDVQAYGDILDQYLGGYTPVPLAPDHDARAEEFRRHRQERAARMMQDSMPECSNGDDLAFHNID